MRACGVSILQIVAPIIVIAFILTCTCLYLQLQVGPHYLGEARNLVKNVLVEQPTAIFEPGIPVRYSDLYIYIGSKDDNKIRDIQVYRMGKNGKWEQDVTAASGVVEVDKENQLLNVILENATVAAYEGGGSNKTMRRTFSRQAHVPD